ncbi:unannotated protein [freshwater metagenome]|uniref:Unannotated protein n=1 Tax=freshwater metagenome TaxID=449393 RepID=A0A6J6F761_9ZZZZ
MARIDPLIAKDATNLKNAIESADKKTLQRKLQGDAQVRVKSQGVVMRNERTCSGAALLQIQNGCFNLEVTTFAKHASDCINRGKSRFKHASSIWIHREVDIPLAVTRVDIGKTLPLIGKRTQRFA